MPMNALILIAAGTGFALAMNAAFQFWRRSQSRAKRDEAAAVLKKRGLTPHLYLATLGVDDDELRDALDEFAFSGYIIMNAQDEVIGKICPKVMKGPHLRLVVSNS